MSIGASHSLCISIVLIHVNQDCNLDVVLTSIKWQGPMRALGDDARNGYVISACRSAKMGAATAAQSLHLLRGNAAARHS